MSGTDRDLLKRVHNKLEAAVLALEMAGDCMPFFRARVKGKFCKKVWQVVSFAKARPGHDFTAELVQYFVIDYTQHRVTARMIPCTPGVERSHLAVSAVAFVVASEDLELELVKRGDIVEFEWLSCIRVAGGGMFN